MFKATSTRTRPSVTLMCNGIAATQMSARWVIVDACSIILSHTSPLTLLQSCLLFSLQLPFPHKDENTCDGGTVYGDEFCLCSTTVVETAAHSSLPSRAQVLDLAVGAHDPAMFDFDATEDYTQVASSNDGTIDEVVAYKKGSEADYSKETVFRVFKDEYSSEYIYLKNVESIVRVCDGKFSFRNSPTFYDIADPELISAYQEVEAYIDYVHNHPSAPPFVCDSLLKHFGYSNPSPQHVLACSTAFKSGRFTLGTQTFGDGKRGNLAAISASIVLSDDALSPTVDLDPTAGGLKSPLLKLTQAMRSFKLTRALHHRRTDAYVANDALFGESPYGIPDQFSFFNPFNLPAGAHAESYVSITSSSFDLPSMTFRFLTRCFSRS